MGTDWSSRPCQARKSFRTTRHGQGLVLRLRAEKKKQSLLDRIYVEISYLCSSRNITVSWDGERLHIGEFRDKNPKAMQEQDLTLMPERNISSRMQLSASYREGCPS